MRSSLLTLCWPAATLSPRAAQKGQGCSWATSDLESVPWMAPCGAGCVFPSQAQALTALPVVGIVLQAHLPPLKAGGRAGTAHGRIPPPQAESLWTRVLETLGKGCGTALPSSGCPTGLQGPARHTSPSPAAGGRRMRSRAQRGSWARQLSRAAPVQGAGLHLTPVARTFTSSSFPCLVLSMPIFQKQSSTKENMRERK